MSQSRLTLGKASLLVLGLGMGALMGVPGFGVAAAPLGPVEGIVRADAGQALAGAEVVLFDDATLAMLEITRTDSNGRFAFGQAPLYYHIFASLPGENPEQLVGSWALDREGGQAGGVEIQLYRGEWFDVKVQESSGEPVPGAEVRVLDAGHGDACVVQRVLTDEAGTAHVLAPQQAHLGIFAAEDQAAHWLTSLDLSEPREPLLIQLPEAKRLTGSVDVSGGEALEGALLSVWDADFQTWRGWTKSDAQGNFAMQAPNSDLQLRIVDPSGVHLPIGRVIRSFENRVHQWNLPLGYPQQIQTERVDEPVAARVWIWSEETHTWGWGALTDDQGLLSAHVAPHHSVVAVPEDPSQGIQEAWNQNVIESTLQLQVPQTEDY